MNWIDVENSDNMFVLKENFRRSFFGSDFAENTVSHKILFLLWKIYPIMLVKSKTIDKQNGCLQSFIDNECIEAQKRRNW
jgi:hypothetical protein